MVGVLPGEGLSWSQAGLVTRCVGASMRRYCRSIHWKKLTQRRCYLTGAQAGDAAQARALALRLGGLPLALRTAGSYLSSGPASVRSFRDYEAKLMLAQRPELSSAASEREIPLTTFEISLSDLSRRKVPQARSLLRLLSCDASPRRFRVACLSRRPCVNCLPLTLNRMPGRYLSKGYRSCSTCSLIEFGNSNAAGHRPILLHPIIADASREQLRIHDGGVIDVPLIRRTAVDLIVGAVAPA